MRPLPALVLAGVTLFAISKLATLNTVQLLDLSLDDFKIDLNGIKVKVKASNPTTNAVTIDNLVGNVFLNEKLSGQLGGFVPVTVPAKGEAILDVSVIVNPVVILMEAVSIFNGSAGVSATLKLVGTVTADGTDIPFTVIRKLI